MGDLRAQITAVKTGERRFLELVERYGRGRCSTRSGHHGPLGGVARARTRTIPDGVYRRIVHGRRRHRHRQEVPIKVKVIVKGDEMTVDLTDVSRQVAASSTPASPRAKPAPRWRSNA